jgi:glycosyltransferase involved in cell wall biosynthesis
MDVTISAVVAVYNPNPELFRKAVDSVLSQTLPVKELILINDGGSDDFRNFLPEDPRIRIFSKFNEGVAATRNFALEHCTGQYIAFLDQDDYWYPDKLQEQTDMISSPDEICMVISPVDIVDNQGIKITKKNRIRVAAGYYRKIQNPDLRLALAAGNFIYSSTPLIHRKVFDRVGFFDLFTNPHDDWDMYLRIVFAGVPVYCYRDHALSVWRSHAANESGKVQAMLISKCRVEKKLLALTHDPKLQAILNTNLLVDYVWRDQIVFKNEKYRIYRALLRRHMYQLLLDRFNYRGDMADLYQDFSSRVRKAMLKAIRRYVVSYFLK